jgi:hypothetical protein
MTLVKMSSQVIPFPDQFPIGLSYHMVPDVGDVFGTYQGTHMYVDPAGGGANGDETAYAISRAAGGKIFVVTAGGVKGGVGPEELQELTDLVVKHGVNSVSIEKNFGNGALSSIWQPSLLKAVKEAGRTCSIDDVWESGQKELRIIDILEPVIENGKLIMNSALIDDDWDQCQKYAVQDRPVYSLFWQIARITRDKNCLIHDDRLDALAGTVRHWVDLLKLDEASVRHAVAQQAYNKQMQNPLGMPNAKTAGMLHQPQSMNRLAIKRRF